MHPAILAEFGDARLAALHSQAARASRRRVRSDPRPGVAPAAWRVRLGTRVIAVGERLAGPTTVAARTEHLGGTP